VAVADAEHALPRDRGMRGERAEDVFRRVGDHSEPRESVGVHAASRTGKAPRTQAGRATCGGRFPSFGRICYPASLVMTHALTSPMRFRTGPFGVVAWVLRSLSGQWDLLWQMVATDLRGRYVGSSLGLFWTVIHPLVMIAIYIVVFSQVMGAKLPG